MMNLQDIVIAIDVAARNRAAASFVVGLQYNFMDNILQIEDVEYEELVPDPGEKPVPVLELVSTSINHHHGRR
ncbi:MAG: hypothetical protein K2M56_00830 [Muribaculaceae bacterium]|nr:hypothetical protein [Muribaculaceae bacterium]